MTASTANLPTILILSGANLGILGSREPEIYGTETLEDHVNRARAAAQDAGFGVEHLQSNHEGDLVVAILAARGQHQAILINPGAFTHYAWALHDALAAFGGPIIEIHLSNPASREPWRHTSVIAPVAAGTIAGFGGLGYELAVVALTKLLRTDSE